MDTAAAQWPEVGAAAPRLDLRNQHGETVQLAALGGAPVLIMFYPFAFSPVCSAELTEVYRRWAEFERIPARLLAVSCDAMHTLRAYAEQLASQTAEGEPAGVELLSDFWPHGEAAQRYGVLNPATGAPQRVSFLLDGQLRLRHRVASADGDARSLDHTLELLGRLTSA